MSYSKSSFFTNLIKVNQKKNLSVTIFVVDSIQGYGCLAILKWYLLNKKMLFFQTVHIENIKHILLFNFQLIIQLVLHIMYDIEVLVWMKSNL